MSSTRELIENVNEQLDAQLAGDGELDKRRRIRIGILCDEQEYNFE
jgi:hypothetical protein